MGPRDGGGGQAPGPEACGEEVRMACSLGLGGIATCVMKRRRRHKWKKSDGDMDRRGVWPKTPDSNDKITTETGPDPESWKPDRPLLTRPGFRWCGNVFVRARAVVGYFLRPCWLAKSRQKRVLGAPASSPLATDQITEYIWHGRRDLLVFGLGKPARRHCSGFRPHRILPRAIIR